MRLLVLFVSIAVLSIGAEAAVRIYRPARASDVVLALPGKSSDSDAIARARALQFRHEFRAAEQTLSPLLEREPRNLTARLLRAQIRIHLEDGAGAMQDCSALLPLADLLTSTVCIAQVRALNGDVERAYAMLASLLEREEGAPAVRSWGAGVAAELAQRRGDVASAERWYRTALTLDPDSHYPRVAYEAWLRSQTDRASTSGLESRR